MLGTFMKRFQSKLYTWGSSTSSLGYETSKTTTSVPTPKQISIDEPIKKCVLGSYHSALITESGNLYTFGNGSYGMLGHDDEKSYVQPKKIESLSKLDIKVKDVALGSYHTAILTTDGEVWTMGYGGDLSGGFLRKIFSQSGGGLGHGDLHDKFVPSVIISLKNHEDIVQIAAGAYHTIALGASGNLYGWGKGEMGVLGNGSTRTLNSPSPNKYFAKLLEGGIRITKIAACKYSNIVLLNNGKLLVWGWNEVGQLALGNYARADLYDTEKVPTEVTAFQEIAIKDFRLGEDSSVFLSDEDRVFFAGIRLYREPKEMKVPENTTVKKIFTCRKVGGFITGNFICRG